MIRDEEEFHRTVRYVLNNPVKAGLVSHWKEWKWTYCHPDVEKTVSLLPTDLPDVEQTVSLLPTDLRTKSDAREHPPSRRHEPVENYEPISIEPRPQGEAEHGSDVPG